MVRSVFPGSSVKFPHSEWPERDEGMRHSKAKTVWTDPPLANFFPHTNFHAKNTIFNCAENLSVDLAPLDEPMLVNHKK